MLYNSLVIASYIEKKCKDNKFYDLNNTKIQKLLYCCYGSVLAIKNKRLCLEYPRAWQYGPVFPKVFKYFKKNKTFNKISPPEFQTDIKSILDMVIEFFGKFNSGQLSDWSHEEGSPWHSVIKLQGKKFGSFIPDEDIKDYFEHYVIEK